jgi:hypothetical protein
VNYYVKGPIVDSTWGLASEGLKRRYKMMKNRLPTYQELEKFRMFLSDPKPTKKEMHLFYKGGDK